MPRQSCAEAASPSQDALNLLASWAATDDDIERSAPDDDSEPADPADPADPAETPD
ncbi:hypothetical protein [Streptomyces canus]|uniref:hypothetical protein n=1 Tax=Streptomyces canus TaxID=58343 RepID=UPI0034216B3B